MPYYSPWGPSSPITLEPHDEKWQYEFAAAAAHLRQILAGLPIITIEHVGSTSIPDLLAKPIIDIDIEVLPENFEPVRDALLAKGYIWLGEGGIPGRHAFWMPGTGNTRGEPVRSPDGKKERRRNTYIVFPGSLALKNHRDLKRVLLEDAQLRKEYGECKRELVMEYERDWESYNVGKNRIVEKILMKAGRWSKDYIAVVTRANWYGRQGDYRCY